MEAKLVIVGGNADVRQYDLALPTIVGRGSDCSLTLIHPLVSRQHCELFESNGILMVRDLDSRNGTFVGDMRITSQAMPVKPGDLLTVGGVTFRVIYSTSDEANTDDWNSGGRTVEAPLSFEPRSLESSASELAAQRDQTTRRPSRGP